MIHAESPTLSFIGAGNMARSLIIGLRADQARNKIWVADPEQQQLDAVRQHWPEISTTTDNGEAVAQSDIVILAVKPQIMPQVCEGLVASLQNTQTLIISIAAGIREHSLNTWLGGNRAIVRCMPNTPALVQSGATGLYANAKVSNEQRNQAERILRAVGITLWCENEADMDAITAVSGSGPAYFFLVMEAMQTAGEKLGLSPEAARLLVLQTAFGAAKLGLESNESPTDLRQKVTSKGGTTEAALSCLIEGGLHDLFTQALNAAAQRSRELADNTK